MATYRALIAADVPTRTAAVLAGIPRATATRKPRTTPLPAVTVTPANKLGPLERARILALVNSPRFVDLPPIQIYAQLLDEACISRRSQRSTGSCRRSGKSGSVVVSPSIRPGRSRTHRNSTCQVFSWDITKLAGPIKDKYYDCYVMIDIFSRYIVGAVMHASESAVLAAEMMSRTVAVLLSDLEVTKSHSRPRVSNNNPYSESWFKTLKFAPVFPERFGSLTDASVFMAAFVEGYNHSHRHTGLGLNTPADFHYGLAAGKGRRSLRGPRPGEAVDLGAICHGHGSEDPGLALLDTHLWTGLDSTIRNHHSTMRNDRVAAGGLRSQITITTQR